MNIGILAFGSHIRKRIYPCLCKNNNFNVKGFYTRNNNKGQNIQSEYKIKFFRNKLDLIKSKDIEIIYIASPPNDHFNDIKLSLKNNKNVICEKPIALSYKDFSKLISIAKKNKLFLFQANQYKFHKHYNFVKNLILKDLDSKSKDRNLHLSFKIPMLDKSNFRIDSKFKNSSLHDIGFYPIDFSNSIFKKIKLINRFTIQKPFNLYGNIIARSNRTNIYCEWGIGFQYSNSISYNSSMLHLFSENIFTKPDNFKPKIITKKGRGNLKDIILKSEDPYKNMLNYFHNVIVNKNFFEFQKFLNSEKQTIQHIDKIKI